MKSSYLSYPHETVSPVVEIVYIDGIRFDICEVDKSCYDLISKTTIGQSKKPMARFFLCVEERFIYGYNSAEKACNSLKEDNWSFFCKTKEECKDLIKKYEDSLSLISKWYDRANKSERLANSYLPRIQKKKQQLRYMYGVS